MFRLALQSLQRFKRAHMRSRTLQRVCIASAVFLGSQACFWLFQKGSDSITLQSAYATASDAKMYHSMYKEYHLRRGTTTCFGCAYVDVVDAVYTPLGYTTVLDAGAGNCLALGASWLLVSDKGRAFRRTTSSALC